MISISQNDYRLKNPSYYNIYPIYNEISVYGAKSGPDNNMEKLLLDDFYGRVFSEGLCTNSIAYGPDSKMPSYPSGASGDIIDFLRVPYRKIPIYYLNSVQELSDNIRKIENANNGHEILLRGQTNIYKIDRSSDEKKMLFGSDDIKEPSFLPSHLRQNFDENFMHCMWQSQASMLLHDVGVQYYKENNPQLLEYRKEVDYNRGSFFLTAFSLGIAQHYGMPSIGLDLTKKIEVAIWFATNKISIDTKGLASSSIISSYDESTVFVFRCPSNAVFPYSNVKPKIFPVGRPDRQDAWFGHVGWGYARNQLGNYLVCGFRIDKNIANTLPDSYSQWLFPSETEDQILEYFLKMKAMEKYEGEAKRAINKIYKFNHV